MIKKQTTKYEIKFLRILTVVFLFIAPVLPSNSAKALNTDRLTVRLAQGTSSAALRYLAEIGEPQSYRILPSETIDQVVNQYYGAIDQTLVELTKQENSWLIGQDGGLIARDKSVDISMPAGPSWGNSVTAIVPKGARVGELAILYTGFEGKDTLRNIAKINKTTVQNLNSVAEGDQLVLPYQVNSVNINLRPQFRERAEEVSSILKSLDPGKVLIAEPGPEINLIGFNDNIAEPEPEKNLIGLNDNIQPATAFKFTCAKPDNNYVPPFDSNDLQNILNENRARDRERNAPPLQSPPVVAVVDTGISPNETRFTFWKNPDESRGMLGVNEDDNEFTDDIVGADIANRDGDPSPDINAKDEFINHGTFVAGLVYGGTRNGEFWAPNRDRIQLLAAKVSGGMKDFPNIILGASVLNAIRYVNERAQIVNMSIEKYSEWGALQDQIALSSGTLFVTAAGNQGRNVETSLIYPAALGGQHSRNVITVGTFDQNGIASFSNRGRRAVDLLAPGCDLESTIFNSSYLISGGTSASAPLVSYTAALLYDAGLRKPWEIKHRIIGSTDPDPTLRGKGQVWSEGRLDVAAALDLYQDRIRLVKDNNLIRGVVSNPSIDADGDPIPIRHVLQLVPLDVDTNGYRVKIALGNAQPLSFDEYTTKTSNITIRTIEGVTKTFSLSEIRSFVRRKF